MAFEQYEHGGQLPESFVRITNYKHLRIGAGVVRSLCPVKPERVALYFDNETKKVALWLLMEDDMKNAPFSFALNSSRSDWHLHTAIMGFVNHHNIKLPVTVRNPEIKEVDGKRMIVFPVEVDDGN